MGIFSRNLVPQQFQTVCICTYIYTYTNLCLGNLASTYTYTKSHAQIHTQSISWDNNIPGLLVTAVGTLRT